MWVKLPGASGITHVDLGISDLKRWEVPVYCSPLTVPGANSGSEEYVS
jgi:hypothetical protein